MLYEEIMEIIGKEFNRITNIYRFLLNIKCHNFIKALNFGWNYLKNRIPRCMQFDNKLIIFCSKEKSAKKLY